jgi:N-acetylglucosaminyl-diphospho-decaprenol L-rhamnosyltransferase
VSAAPDITISLVNTNNRELLLDCLRSLERAAAETVLQTIVVDNASTDGSAAAVREAFPDVEVVERDRRHGFGANHNQAIARAKGRYVLILNEDTVLGDGMLDRMRRFMDQHPEVGACGPKILNADGSQQPSAFRFPTPARVALTTLTLQRRGWIQSQPDHVARVDWVCGAAILARLPALRAVGGFDERLFIYSEDPDLCLRMREAGYATAYFPYASLVHFENATTDGVPERRIAQMERSRALYARKHHGAAGEYAVRGLTAATFAARAAAAKALLMVPGGERVKAVDEDAPRRFAAHVRAALRPGSMPGIEEAAEQFNTERAGSGTG